MRDELFALSKIKTYRNMPDLVAEALKEAIVRGEFKGGVQLKQDEIAKQFEVSLIPVREALIQLEGMQLVKCIRNKGALVTELSLQEMKALFEVRKVMEVGSVMLIYRPPQEKLEKMELLVHKMEQTEDFFIFSRYNRLFYLLLCEMAGNVELNAIYEKMFVRVERYLNYIFYTIPELRNDKSHYKHILELLKQGKKTELSQLIQERSEIIQQVFSDYLETHYGNIEKLDWNKILPFE